MAMFGVGATAQEALYPAAQCAAFWYGYADYATLSPYLDFEQSDVEAAEAFRAVAVRLGAPETEIIAFMDAERPRMTRLMESYIYDGDAQSRDIFERLSTTCEDFAARHPETRNLK
jgi:hypothetical protein